MLHLRPLLLLLCVIAAWQACADSFEARVDASSAIPLDRFRANGDSLLLWLPSEQGMQSAHTALGNALAARGVEVWNADLFAANFLAPSSDALAAVDVQSVARLIEYARTQTRKRIFLISNDLGAMLVLRSARLWQLAHPGSTRLGGVVLISPQLLTHTPEAGHDAVYLPIASATNLPVFVLQPALSAGHWRLRELTAHLEQGGSAVYTRSLPQVRDRFFFRNDALPEEVRQTAQLPVHIDYALRLMSGDSQIRAARSLPETREAPTTTREEKFLRQYQRDPKPWPLDLRDLHDRNHTLRQYAGQVVLVNFWAGWCPPC